MNSELKFAPLSRRLTAFLVDVVPISFALAAIFYLTTDFGQTLDRYLSDSRSEEDHRKFLSQRNGIRDLAALIFVFYAAKFDSSPSGATLGKRLLGIRVVRTDGGRISFQRAFGRSFAKMFSILPAGIGCVVAFRSKTKQTWHDKLSSTYVLMRESPIPCAYTERDKMNSGV